MAHTSRAFVASLLRAVLPIAPLLAVACAAPQADGKHSPETSRDVVDSAPPLAPASPDEGMTDEDPSPDPQALIDRRPPPPPPRPASRPVESPIASGPYRVEVVGESARRLPTFRHAGRTYVLGALGTRYSIHVTNPTGRRVEAVVSVDGLDAIDGLVADYVHKSGYVIAPYGDVTIDGFRTSMDEVAAFRFSAVSDSYAGRKGHDRNVGVIGVAFFAERELPPPPLPPMATAAPEAEMAPATPSPGYSASGAGGGRGLAAADEAAGVAPPAKAAPARRHERPGLGTEFGEQRSSVVEYTEFQRGNPTRPSAVAEVRYNDRSGLLALGIPLAPPPPSEAELRETASPFPANRFASAPPPRY